MPNAVLSYPALLTAWSDKRQTDSHNVTRFFSWVSSLSSRKVGDGTTSVVIVAAELLKRANELIKNNIHPTTVMTGYRLALKEAVKYIKANLCVPVDKLGRSVLLGGCQMMCSLLGRDRGAEADPETCFGAASNRGGIILLWLAARISVLCVFVCKPEAYTRLGRWKTADAVGEGKGTRLYVCRLCCAEAVALIGVKKQPRNSKQVDGRRGWNHDQNPGMSVSIRTLDYHPW